MKFQRAVLVTLLATLVLAATSPAQDSQIYERAMTEFRAKNYEAAAKLFASVDSANPAYADAPLFEGKCLVNLRQYADAEKILRQYVAEHPASDDGLYLLGFVLNRENKASESLNIYTQAASLKPPTGDDLKIVGLNYVLLNDYEDAIKWLKRSVEMNSSDKEAWYFLGRAYYSRGRLPESETAFRTVLQLDPRHEKAENNLGLILEAEGKHEEAAKAYRQAIAWSEQASVNDEQPYLNLGNLLMEQDRLSDAIPLLEKAAQIAPQDATCHLKLGSAYLHANREADAQRELEHSTQLDPENAQAHFQLGRLYKKMKSLDRSRKEFDRVDEIQSRANVSEPHATVKR